MDIPVYYLEINNDMYGMYAVSLVENPAMNSDFVCFSKEEDEVELQIQDEEQRIVSGVIIKPDYPILRKKDGKLYYVMFSKETIKQIAEKFLHTNQQNNVTADHRYRVEDINLVELYIKDTSKGIDPNFIDCPDGSLIGTYKIRNEEMWTAIKSGVFKGFSLEGSFNSVLKEDAKGEDVYYVELLEMVKKIKKVK